MRTPVGARGWDTPTGSTSRRPDEDDEDDFDELEGATPGPSRPKKRRKPVAPPRVRDDLSLDAFQRNYTSEDNASFVQIVDEENRQRREERWGWAWEAQKRAEERRIEGEERRKMILDAATSGNWRVDGEGRRLIGGLAEGGTDRAEGEAWKDERKLIAAVPGDTDEVSEDVDGADGAVGSALVPHASSSALIKATDAVRAEPNLREEPLPPEHPLGRALSQAGLPATALVSAEDGALVPLREATSGSGQGRGRGDEEKHRREETERAVMGEEREEHLGLAGSGADHWGFKVGRIGSYLHSDSLCRPATTFTFPPTPIPTHTPRATRPCPPSRGKPRRRSPTPTPAFQRRKSQRRRAGAVGEGAVPLAVWSMRPSRGHHVSGSTALPL
jgi:protein DGCR14